MGIVAVDLFITLDGVYQAPGGPEEDPSDGFEYGGWQAPYFDDESGAVIGAGIDRLDALLLGRKTYDIFADYWPKHTDTPIGAKFEEVPKFVASRTLTDPTWARTTVVTDIAAEIPAIKERFEEIHVIGSGALARSLLAADLVDRLNLYLYPIVFGAGKRLFDTGTVPAAFSLAQQPIAFPKGAVSLVYERAGVPVTGIQIDE
ncbi:dihydrofolate reductase [Agromyces flavus]|uniref:Dihydrofolate reductase n=1 Tax=Agromyces flavus TaxID=589382 RepID=A0A1H1VV25_9MICO|nr:dihydrofolate reductase family protein [Agromyces flavus]MCP2366017.1 dihydrofolate reductase [Agromyces flavus]GGI43833.1 deaminase reductase [Agromyces flavus]SDS88632.1 Dihydrofolate reductase [Agromyces flavus]